MNIPSTGLRPCRHPLRAGALLLLAIPFTLPAQAHGPFPWITTNYVQLLDAGNTKSVDDVIGSPYNTNEIYCTKTGNDYREVRKYTLTRTTNGTVNGATLDWISPSLLPGVNLGLKALDLYNADTIFYTLEQGGANKLGSVGRLTGLGSSPVHLEAAATSGTAYHPEGIAIDRRNNLLYVMNDDGDQTGGGGGAIVAQYAINPTTLELTFRWSTMVQAGEANGNDGIVLSDGRVAVVAGSTSVNLYAVAPGGAAIVNLLSGSVTGELPQALLEFDGYLYLAWEDGKIQAFDASDLTRMITTPVATWDLDTILGGDVSIGGIGLTADYHLLVGSRVSGSGTDKALSTKVFLFPSSGPPTHAAPTTGLILTVL